MKGEAVGGPALSPIETVAREQANAALARHFAHTTDGPKDPFPGVERGRIDSVRVNVGKNWRGRPKLELLNSDTPHYSTDKISDAALIPVLTHGGKETWAMWNKFATPFADDRWGEFVAGWFPPASVRNTLPGGANAVRTAYNGREDNYQGITEWASVDTTTAKLDPEVARFCAEVEQAVGKAGLEFKGMYFHSGLNQWQLLVQCPGYHDKLKALLPEQ